MSHATKYFQQAFPKYDDLNESVQENVSAIRVVKAYVREEQETSKLRRASENIYNIFVKAETNLVFNAPMMQTDGIHLYSVSELVRSKDDRKRFPDDRRTDESSYILHEYSDESDDVVDGICHGCYEYGKCETYLRSVK